MNDLLASRIRRPGLATIPALAVLLALAGCGDAKDSTPRNVTANGEILPRSVGDDMLPYDTVSSLPPLAAPGATDEATGRTNSGKVGNGDAAAETDAADRDAPRDEPRASPSTTPSTANAAND